jgi:serine phosphatase RsbU (regulator of sigma subunit)/HAMP domain-containing protein
LAHVFKSITERFRRFWSEIDLQTVKSASFIFYLVCWFVVYYFLIFAFNHASGWIAIWIIFLGIIWFTVNRNIINAVNPPVEVLLGLIIVIYGFTFFHLNSIFNNLRASASSTGLESRLPGFLTYFLLGLLTLLSGLLLTLNTPVSRIRPVENSNHPDTPLKRFSHYRQRVIFWYVVIGMLGHQLVFFENIFYLYVFEFFLFLLLLNKTGWLEKLSRYELYIYFLIFLCIYLSLHDPASFQKVKLLEIRYKLTWFSFPLYLHLLIKLYFLALLVKIPIVLIYNHASLARKLSMAGLFQSTFPQFFQFLFLISIFFFFISGWQADKLRQSLQDEIEQIRAGNINPSYTYYNLNIRPGDQSLLCSGYAPCILRQPFDSNGIIALSRSRTNPEEQEEKEDYFLYIKGRDTLFTSLQLIRIDTNLVNYLSSKLNVMAGNGLICYPYAPKYWQDFLYNINVLKSESNIRIYPFSFLSKNQSWSVMSHVKQRPEFDVDIQILGQENYSGDQKFIIGRLIIPVVQSDHTPWPYFAFDIYLAFTTEFWTSSLVQITVLLILLFLILNFFIIGRVGKFGEQINKIIVQRFQQLKSGIKEISAGNLDYKFKMEGEDEFIELARHFNQMGDRLKTTIAEAREKDRLDQELQIARQVQLSLLPEKLPHLPGYQIVATIRTANEVGGDFYDVLHLGDHRFLFTIGDVSGKGSSAAFYMAQVISLLRFSQQFIMEPLEIVLRLNHYFSTQIKDRQIFITAIVGILDSEKNILQFVRAGHPLPILIPGDKHKEIRELRCKGLGIGLTNSRQKYEETIQVVKMELAAEDLLLFYTDGVVEAARPSAGQTMAGMEVFGEKRLKDILIAARGKNAGQILSIVSGELNEFYNDHPQIDDHTLLIIQKS